MVLARRLIVGSAPLPALRAPTSTPAGGWTQIQDPKAFYYNGATYFVYAPDAGTTSDLTIGKYVHATGATTTTSLVTSYEDPTDNHSSPSVIVREPDHRIVVAAAHHAETSSPSVWISTNAEDISAFGSAITPDADIGAAHYTYMVLYQTADEKIWMFYRDYIVGTSTGRLGYTTSSDGGTTWSSRVVPYTAASGHVPYWRIVSDWDGRFDIFVTDLEPTSSKLGHFWMDASDEKAYTSADVEITASKPFVYSDITQVHAATAWSWGGSSDALGRPATILMQDTGSDNAIKVARLRSGSWQVNTVIASVGGQLTGNQYGSGCAIHHADPNIVYVAKKATHWEMWRYISIDDGVTWTGTQLTTGSAHDHVWADVVHKAGPGLEGVWLFGDYTSDNDYAFGIRGFG